MRFLLAVFLSAASAFGLSNAVSITDLSGSIQTNRVITIPRYFADKEICQYPQPYTSGVAISFWQADIRNRWPADAACAGGYVKVALITIEQTISGNGTVVVEFRNSASANSGGSGLSKALMLAFDTGAGAGVWPSRGTYTTGGITFSTSAKTMIASDHYKVLEDGPLRTSVLVREGPEAISGALTRATSFGWQCTATCVAPYDTATWANNATYYSNRPSYVVTFLRSPTSGTKTVETDFLLDNGWMDRAQDQRIESMVLYKDDTGGLAGYTAPAVFGLPFRGRMFETIWSTNPPATNIDFNFKYLYYSGVIPPYGPEYTVSLAAETLELTAPGLGFASATSDQGATVTTTSSPHMGKGQYQFYNMQGAAGGSSPVTTVIPRWDVRWLVRQSPGLLTAVLGNAKAAFHAPFIYLDDSTSGVFRRGHTEKAFGRPMSIDSSRPTIMSGSASGTLSADSIKSPSGDIISTSCAVQSGSSGCMVAMSSNAGAVGWASTRNNATMNAWGHDIAHRPGNFLVAYLATGKYVYIEGMMNEGSFVIAAGPPGTRAAVSDNFGDRWTGVFFDAGNAPRSTAWSWRTLTWAATFSPDGTPEQGYYQDRLLATLEMTRGRFNIGAAGRNCTGFDRLTETDPWKMGRCYYEVPAATNPLHVFLPTTSFTFGSVCYCNISPQAGALYAQWQHAGYLMSSLNHIRKLGWDVTSILQLAADYTIHLMADSAVRSPLFSRLYYLPGYSTDDHHYVQSWSDIYNAKQQGVVLAKPMSATDTTITVVGMVDSNTFNPAENQLEAQIMGGQWFSSGGEIFKILSFSGGSVAQFKAVSTVDTATDRLTIPSHGYASGEATLFQGPLGSAGTAYTLDAGMQGNSTCGLNKSGARTNPCWFYVKVIDVDTVELYKDLALTQKVDLTGGGSSNVFAVRSTAAIMAACGTGSAPCRGQYETTATAHIVGDTITRQPLISYFSRDPSSDIDGSHGPYYTAGMSAAVDIDATAVDSLTGATITADRAYEVTFGSIRWKDRFGGGTSCAGLGISSCDDPVFGQRPTHRVKNVVATAATGTATLRYTAPTGDVCRVGVSATPFASTDSASDTSDAMVTPARQFTTTQSAGTYYYRITCGPGGGTARVGGTLTVN